MSLICIPKSGDKVTVTYLPDGKKFKGEVIEFNSKNALITLKSLNNYVPDRDWIGNSPARMKIFRIYVGDQDFILQRSVLWQLKNQAIGLLEQLRNQVLYVRVWALKKVKKFLLRN